MPKSRIRSDTEPLPAPPLKPEKQKIDLCKKSQKYVKETHAMKLFFEEGPPNTPFPWGMFYTPQPPSSNLLLSDKHLNTFTAAVMLLFIYVLDCIYYVN